MSAGFNDNQVINGTWGELWIDGEYMAEVISCKAELKANYTDITRVRRLTTGKKLTGIEGSGEVKLHKVTSTMMKKIADALQEGKTPTATIISSLSDPDNGGNERVALYDCAFEGATLADWEAQKNGEETFSFSFTSWEILDSI